MLVSKSVLLENGEYRSTYVYEQGITLMITHLRGILFLFAHFSKWGFLLHSSKWIYSQGPISAFHMALHMKIDLSDQGELSI